MEALNGNVLVDPIKDQAVELFSESDSRKDLQYAKVLIVEEGSKLEVGDVVIFNPRSLTNIVVKGELKGALHESNIMFID